MGYGPLSFDDLLAGAPLVTSRIGVQALVIQVVANQRDEAERLRRFWEQHPPTSEALGRVYHFAGQVRVCNNLLAELNTLFDTMATAPVFRKDE